IKRIFYCIERRVVMNKGKSDKTYLSNEQCETMLEHIQDRIIECKAIINNSKKQLNTYGQPVSYSTANLLRTTTTRDLCLLGLVRDLLLMRIDPDEWGISPLGLKGLDKLVFPVRRHQ